jgi:hypothetical protein
MDDTNEPIVACDFDIKDSREVVRLSIFKPHPATEGPEWVCRVRLAGLRERDHLVRGVNALQALLLAQYLAASELYNSDLYRDGRLGLFGEFGGDLLLTKP